MEITVKGTPEEIVGLMLAIEREAGIQIDTTLAEKDGDTHAKKRNTWEDICK